MGTHSGRGDPCAIGHRDQVIFPSVRLSHSETTSHPLITLTGAATSTSDTPNSNVALFDLAFPGSQPVSVIVYNAVK